MRKKNKASRLLALLCSLAMVLSMMPLAASVYADEPESAAGGVEINEVNFPDAAFREYVKQFDTDGSDALSASEISSVTAIGNSEKGFLNNVTDLRGIEYFTSLTLLNCSDNNITVWPNLPSSLETLTCINCGLSELPMLPAGLKTLNCGENNFTSLSINSTSLTEVNCDFCQSLTTIDVSGCTALTSISCFGSVKELTLAEGKSLITEVAGVGGTASITKAAKNEEIWTASVEISPDSGYGCKGFLINDGMEEKCSRDSIDKISVNRNLFYLLSFTPIIEDFTDGQSFTQGEQISFTAKPINDKLSEEPTSWTVRQEGGDPIFSGSFDESKKGTIDTSSLSAGAYILGIGYGGSEEQNGEASHIRYISFNIEESHYTGPSYYYLNVENGSGDGAYAYHTRVDIAADPAPEGKEFDKWVRISGEGIIENADAEKTVYTMGFGNATVTATYKDKKPAEPENTKYQLTVENGSGSGAYAAGTKVAIKADKALKGKVFDKWVLIDGKGLIKEKGGSNTVFTMAESDATVKAVYKKQTGTPAESDDPEKADKPSKPDNQKEHDNLDNPQTGDTQMLFAWMTILAAAAAGIYIFNKKKDELEE